ncbi:helix-turn-helix domain-containing protein [Faecalicatena sp. AGMB00832]|uniref:Helix-turn-helix domain-containing protein n=1 Tax=Faecalicatena faecalis TaxID=2726362 RepID=A0ABS6D1V9_9FIRM|nr:MULTISPECIES: helix-turn-helix transcriptional regulator [Faecalicatena]MBU3875476.1 helix-turn-helix domain-containing protein [Faecalicatena faecalis]MCI6466082.1 helix-turn-helix domain-containing protein [Faecalicatena sp.]MDY5621112.1 helix-turn-helix transcriptional regulator [Lachnospiraceae bacterium]
MRFAAMLKELREEKGITQSELADQLGITRSTVAGYETKGKQPDYERLIEIARFFDVSVDYLLTGYEYYPISIEGSPKHSLKRLLKVYASLSKVSQDSGFDYLEYLSYKEQGQDSRPKG